MGLAQRPAFVDPVTGGAADPIVFPGASGEWWLYYTQRRVADHGPGVRWCHGTSIGRALSLDGGATWQYRGVVPASVVGGEDAQGGEAAWLFYFCHVQEGTGGAHLPRTVAERARVVHVGRLHLDGGVLKYDRNRRVEIDLRRRTAAGPPAGTAVERPRRERRVCGEEWMEGRV